MIQAVLSVTERWEIVETHPLFRSDLDHAQNYPGGEGYPYEVHHPVTYGYYTHRMFVIDDIEWCAEHCRGSFYRIHDRDAMARLPEDTTEILKTNPDQFHNYLYHVALSTITFELLEDAIRFKLGRL